MTPEVVVWLAVLLALAGLAIVVLRRMSVLAGRTRDLERFQRAATSLEARLALVVEPVVGRLDEIRRHAGDPHALVRELEPAQGELRALVAESRATRPPRGMAELGAALTAELERASRAADLVEHGLDALLAGRSGRELEAQTSLKRGALNLRHAREASSRIVTDIKAVSPADLVERRGAGGRIVPVGRETSRAPATYLVDGWETEDSPQHPRM